MLPAQEKRTSEILCQETSISSSQLADAKAKLDSDKFQLQCLRDRLQRQRERKEQSLAMARFAADKLSYLKSQLAFVHLEKSPSESRDFGRPEENRPDAEVLVLQEQAFDLKQRCELAGKRGYIKAMFDQMQNERSILAEEIATLRKEAERGTEIRANAQVTIQVKTSSLEQIYRRCQHLEDRLRATIGSLGKEVERRRKLEIQTEATKARLRVVEAHTYQSELKQLQSCIKVV